MKVTIFLAALTALAAGAPTPATDGAGATGQVGRAVTNNTSLPGIVWIDGKQVDFRSPIIAEQAFVGAGQVCTADDDVLTCATKIGQSWHVVGNFTSEHRTMTIPVNAFDYTGGVHGATVDLDYDIVFSDCTLTDPVVVNQTDAFFCNSGNGCKQTFQFTHSATATNQYGFRIGSQLKASSSIGIVSTELSVSGDFNQNWSNAETTSTTVSREYDMQAGEVCAPTTIQFDVQCSASVKFNTPGYDGNGAVIINGRSVVDVAMVHTDDNIFNQYTHVCTQNPGQTYVQSVQSDQLTQVCNALFYPGTAKMDLDSTTGTAPWAIEGCMFQ